MLPIRCQLTDGMYKLLCTFSLLCPIMLREKCTWHYDYKLSVSMPNLVASN